MRGLGYALSWPVAEWIGSANLTRDYQAGSKCVISCTPLRYRAPRICASAVAVLSSLTDLTPSQSVWPHFIFTVEDAKMGRVVRFLDPETDPVQWIDWDDKLGDWNQIEINTDTVGYHWLKQLHWMPMVKRHT